MSGSEYFILRTVLLLRSLVLSAFDSFFWFSRNPYSVGDETLVNIIREGKQVIPHKATITKLSGKQVHLSDGTTVETDMLIHATGWQTHVHVFNEKDCLELGLPVRIDHLSSLDPNLQYPSERSNRAKEVVLQSFPRLAHPPIPPRTPTYTQYRLYRFIVPLPMVQSDDRSLAFVGFFHGNATAVIYDTVALWAVAWLTGEIKVTQTMEDIEWEIDLCNAYIRQRYLTGGVHASYLAYEWLSVCDRLNISQSHVIFAFFHLP
jgi:hypothetical protein